MGEHVREGEKTVCVCVYCLAYQLSSVGEAWLWMGVSGDRRVSVWSADWTQDVCHLLDWLSFPGPPCAPDGTRLKKGSKVTT